MTKRYGSGIGEIVDNLKAFKTSDVANVMREAMAKTSCPDHSTLPDYLAGGWSPEVRRNFRMHLLQCSRCLVALDALAGPHTALALQFAVVTGMLPAGSLGQALKTDVMAHISRCHDCQEEFDRLHGEIVINAELAEGIRPPEWVGELVGGLVAVFVVRQNRALLSRGARRSAAQTLDAVVLDASGEVVVNQDGMPESMPFSIADARVEADGRLVVNLSARANDVSFDRSCDLAIRILLNHEDKTLELTSAPLQRTSDSAPYPGWTVALRQRIAGATAVDRIASQSMIAFVQPKTSTQESRE